jgi:hypothetical protein
VLHQTANAVTSPTARLPWSSGSQRGGSVSCYSFGLEQQPFALAWPCRKFLILASTRFPTEWLWPEQGVGVGRIYPLE